MKGGCRRGLSEPRSSVVSTSTALGWPSVDRRDLKFHAIRRIKEVFTGRTLIVKLAK